LAQKSHGNWRELYSRGHENCQEYNEFCHHEELIMNTNLRKTTYALLLAIFTFGVVGCEQQGPAEKAGEKLDDAITDTGNAIEDACEDVKDEMGAEDKDC
jgi:hypothetical protein